MYLNYDVLSIIISYIDDVQTLYSLILTSKWFSERLTDKFQKCFDPVLKDGQLIKPKIFHPIRQSTIDRHNNHVIISRSGYYKMTEDLSFNSEYSQIGIELKFEGENDVRIWINGNNNVLKLHNGTSGQHFTFLSCKNQQYYNIIIENILFKYDGNNVNSIKFENLPKINMDTLHLSNVSCFTNNRRHLADCYMSNVNLTLNPSVQDEFFGTNPVIS